jgi:hypothetical protein
MVLKTISLLLVAVSIIDIKILVITLIPRAVKVFFYKGHNIKEAGNLFEGLCFASQDSFIISWKYDSCRGGCIKCSWVAF